MTPPCVDECLVPVGVGRTIAVDESSKTIDSINDRAQSHVWDMSRDLHAFHLSETTTILTSPIPLS